MRTRSLSLSSFLILSSAFSQLVSQRFCYRRYLSNVLFSSVLLHFNAIDSGEPNVMAELRCA